MLPAYICKLSTNLCEGPGEKVSLLILCSISEAIDLFRGSDVDLVIQTISPLREDIPPEY